MAIRTVPVLPSTARLSGTPEIVTVVARGLTGSAANTWLVVLDDGFIWHSEDEDLVFGDPKEI